jgi:hypothetical protein
MFLRWFFPKGMTKNKGYYHLFTLAVANPLFLVTQLLQLAATSAYQHNDVQLQCLDDIHVRLPRVIFDVELDMGLLLIPIWCMYRMQVKLLQKDKVWTMFAFGVW